MQNTEALETLWQTHRHPWNHHPSFTLAVTGVTLGAHTLIVPAVKDAWGRTTLAIDGNEERIVALLSVAHGKPVSPRVLDSFRAADALPGQTPTQSFVYREVFAAEGGSDAAPNGVVAGITQPTLNGAIKAKVDGIDGNTTLDDLTTEQMASIYRHEFDRSLGLVGGSAALDRVGDKGAAAALGDTLFWFGDTGGATVVRQAISDTSGTSVEGSGRLGPVAFDRYSQLAQDPATRQTLLDRLSVHRQDKAISLDQPAEARIEHFRFRQ